MPSRKPLLLLPPPHIAALRVSLDSRRYAGKYVQGNICREIYAGKYMQGNICREIYAGKYMQGNICREIYAREP
jgi:ribosomal protein L40E